MSRSTRSAGYGRDRRRWRRRPFDAVVVALSSALLLVCAIVFGRFVLSAPAATVMDPHEVEVTELRAELAGLNHQLQQSQSRCTRLTESLKDYRQQARQQQSRADELSARQQSIQRLLTRATDQRQASLEDLQQYVAVNQPVPPMDVLRFAEALFELQDRTIEHLGASYTSTFIETTSALPTLPGFPPVAAATPARARATALASPTTTSPTTDPQSSGSHSQINGEPLPAPRLVARTLDEPLRPTPRGEPALIVDPAGRGAASKSAPPPEGVQPTAAHAAPPPPTRLPRSTYIAARPRPSDGSEASTGKLILGQSDREKPDTPGITFHDIARSDETSVRR